MFNKRCLAPDMNLATRKLMFFESYQCNSFRPSSMHHRSGQTLNRLLVLVFTISLALIGCSKPPNPDSVDQTVSQTLEATDAKPAEAAATADHLPGKRNEETTAAMASAELKSPVNESTARQSDPGPPAVQPVVNDPAFHEALLDAVDAYLQYSMVNSVAFQAPAECAAPLSDSPPKLSASVDDDSHGQKLYYLFAKDITHYLSQDGTPAPEGQVLVKESWTSKPANPEARNKRTHASGVRINPRATDGDKVLEIGQRTDLFVMMKLGTNGGNGEKTDDGWIYGVVDADSRKVSASGKVASCIECHQETPNDRMFGPAIEIEQ